MTENENARSRLEVWVDRADHAELRYARTYVRGEGRVWTVTLVLDEPGPPTKVVFEASAVELMNASAAIIAGLAEYGIEVP